MTTQPAKPFEDLSVWQKAHEFVLSVYAAIAEALTKSEKPESVPFLIMSQGSIRECRYYLILARDRGHVQNRELSSLLEEIAKLLTRYRSTLMKSDS